MYHEKVLEAGRIAQYELKKIQEKGLKKFRHYDEEDKRGKKIRKNK